MTIVVQILHVLHIKLQRSGVRRLWLRPLENLVQPYRILSDARYFTSCAILQRIVWPSRTITMSAQTEFAVVAGLPVHLFDILGCDVERHRR